MHIENLLDKRQRNNLIQQQEDAKNNREAVKILIDVARTLGRQGLPFRGASTEEGETDGNFHQIVQLMGRHSPVMKKWLDEKRLRPYHTTYMSATSQNEFIELLANDVRSKIKEEVHTAGIYSIMADTTPDTSNKDRLAVAVRYVNPEGYARKRLLEVKETMDKTGERQAY